MDSVIWEKSKRGFPFNIPLEVIIGVSFGAPLVLSFYLLDFTNQYIFDVLLKTIALAVLGFVAANSLIP